MKQARGKLEIRGRQTRVFEGGPKKNRVFVTRDKDDRTGLSLLRCSVLLSDVLLACSLWQSRFGSRPSPSGKTDIAWREIKEREIEERDISHFRRRPTVMDSRLGVRFAFHSSVASRRPPFFPTFVINDFSRPFSRHGARRRTAPSDRVATPTVRLAFQSIRGKVHIVRHLFDYNN